MQKSLFCEFFDFAILGGQLSGKILVETIIYKVMWNTLQIK